MANGVTNKDLYDAIDRLGNKFDQKILRLEVKVDANTTWRNQITGKLTVLFVVIGFGINWAWDIFMQTIKK